MFSSRFPTSATNHENKNLSRILVPAIGKILCSMRLRSSHFHSDPPCVFRTHTPVAARSRAGCAVGKILNFITYSVGSRTAGPGSDFRSCARHTRPPVVSSSLCHSRRFLLSLLRRFRRTGNGFVPNLVDYRYSNFARASTGLRLAYVCAEIKIELPG